MAETIVLDPVAVAAGRTELDITSWIGSPAGVDWGDAALSAYMADQTVGSSPVDYRLPNRQIKIPLTLKTVGAVSFDTIRSQLQAKIGLIQREGGWIMRHVGTTPLYADIVNATLHLGGSWVQAYQYVDVDATLALECIPDFYGDEIALDQISAVGHFAAVLGQGGVAAEIYGNLPGRCRIILAETSGYDQQTLLWGFRCRNYGAAITETLAYEAEALERLDAGTLIARSGASGGTVVQHPSLPAQTWCPVLSTHLGGTVFLTHRGSYRVWGRCYSGTATPTARLLWDVGDLSSPVSNDPVQLPSAATFHLLDFGTVRLDPAPVGPHRWQGVVQAKALQQGDQFEVDQLFFQPLDEAAGRLQAVQSSDSPVGISYTQPAGTAVDDSSYGTTSWTSPLNVTGEDLDPASAYSVGITDSHYLKATGFGFAVPAGATVSGVQINVLRWGEGLIAPVVDRRVRLVKGGTVQTGDRADVTPWPSAWTSTGKTYGGQFDLWGGAWTAAEINDPGFGVAISAGLGNSKANIDFIRATVYYTTSGGFTSFPDAVTFATRTAELRTDGMYRQDSGGTAYGPVSQVTGDLPRIPPANLEGRRVELFVKWARGGVTEDNGIDGAKVQVAYRPSFLFIPGP